jgi:hypothetical protein
MTTPDTSGKRFSQAYLTGGEALSVVLGFLASKDRIPQANRWLDECRRILAEERLRYTIDHAGVVRFSADAQFEEVVGDHPTFGSSAASWCIGQLQQVAESNERSAA